MRRATAISRMEVDGKVYLPGDPMLLDDDTFEILFGAGHVSPVRMQCAPQKRPHTPRAQATETALQGRTHGGFIGTKVKR